MGADSVVGLRTRAAASLVCFKWLKRQSSIVERRGVPRAETFPARARSEFGGGRLGEVRCAADNPAGIVGCRGEFAACVLEADIPPLAREGALGALGGQAVVAHNVLTLSRQGVDIPPKSDGMGHYVLSVASFGKERKQPVRGPNAFGLLF